MNYYLILALLALAGMAWLEVKLQKRIPKCPTCKRPMW